MSKRYRELSLSTLAFRHLALDDAVAAVAGAGFRVIDVVGIPGFCDHLDLDDPDGGASVKASRATAALPYALSNGKR